MVTSSCLFKEIEKISNWVNVYEEDYSDGIVVKLIPLCLLKSPIWGI